MKLSYSLLPVLVGASLAGGAALGVLYFFLKKDDDGDDFFPTTSRLTGVSTTQKTISIPRESVGVVIGKGGSNIRDIQDQTQTKIKMREDSNSDNTRICTITGTVENVEYADSLIKGLIRNQPLITTVDIKVPQSACGRIIGRQGESIRTISSSSGAKIDIENTTGQTSNFSDRRITLKGTAEQIDAAKDLINEKVKEDAGLRQRYEAGARNRTPRRDNKTPQYLTNSAQKQVMGPSAVELDQLHEQMTDYYSKDENKELHILENLEVGQYVAAPFLKDAKWYRAQVLSIAVNEYAPEESQVDLYYVDYGDSQDAPVSVVFELRADFLKLPFQAIECGLAKVKPKDSEWTEEATDLFEDLTYNAKWKSLMCCVDHYAPDRVRRQDRGQREGSPVPVVTLFDIHGAKDVNVAEEMVKNQFAVYLTPAKSTKATPSVPGQKPSSNSSAASSSRAKESSEDASSFSAT